MYKSVEYVVDENGCHVCTSHHRQYGYALIMIRGKRRRLHRIIYEQTYGKIPSGLVIRHTCDNKACINIAHLLLGTHADNQRDKLVRGRSVFGERNAGAKLKEEQVREILQSDEGSAALSIRFGVCRGTIQEIRRRRTWSYLVL